MKQLIHSSGGRSGKKIIKSIQWNYPVDVVYALAKGMQNKQIMK